MQQSGRGGRNGEVSESVIITRVEGSSGRKRSGIMSEYSVEQIDEDAMTEFIKVKTCRRRVLGRHMDGEEEGADCSSTDSVYCDQCRWKGRSSERVERRGHDEMGIKREDEDVRWGEEGGEVIAEERKVSVKETEEMKEGGRDII